MCEAPVVKEELHEESGTDHCFVNDLARHRGGDTQMVAA
jgi:hypothetical protein